MYLIYTVFIYFVGLLFWKFTTLNLFLNVFLHIKSALQRVKYCTFNNVFMNQGHDSKHSTYTQHVSQER